MKKMYLGSAFLNGIRGLAKRSLMLYLSAGIYILWGLICLTISGEANYIVLFRWAVFIPLFIIAFNLPDKNVIWLSLIAVGTVQSVIVVMQQTGIIFGGC